MGLTLHLIRKDFRRSRLILGIWYTILVLAVVTNAMRAQLLEGLAPHWWEVPTVAEYRVGVLLLVTQLLNLVDAVMRVAIVAKLVHEDSVVGSTAFWLSRPVSGGRLLASKAIFLVLAVVVPPIVVQLAVTSQVGISPLTMTEVFVLPVLTAAFLMMLAVLTPSLTKMAALGAILAGVAIVGFLGLSWFAMPLAEDFMYEDALRPLPPWGPLLTVCIAVICHQYLTRRTKRSLVLAFSGIPILLLVPSGSWFLVPF